MRGGSGVGHSARRGLLRSGAARDLALGATVDAEAEAWDERPSYLAAGIVAACVLGLYLLTLAPTTAMWDTSEYIAAAYTFGLPHPPGNPLFVIVGRAFSLLPIGVGRGADQRARGDLRARPPPAAGF